MGGAVWLYRTAQTKSAAEAADKIDNGTKVLASA